MRLTRRCRQESSRYRKSLAKVLETNESFNAGTNYRAGHQKEPLSRVKPTKKRSIRKAQHDRIDKRQEGKLMPAVEQNKLKRAGTGLRAVDHDRAYPGFTLFAPQSGGGNVYLIDLEGKLIHTWQMPYPPGNSGYLTERGTLFYNGKIIEDSKRFISGQPWKGGAALEADWNGRVLWEVRQPDHHHDGIRLRNGNVLLHLLSPACRKILFRRSRAVCLARNTTGRCTRTISSR